MKAEPMAKHELRFIIHACISEVPRDKWNAIWPLHVEGYDFYRIQQEAGIRGFSFNYIGIYTEETLVLIAPVFITDFNMALAMSPFGRLILHRVQRLWPRFLVFKTLFCGSISSEKGIVGIHANYRTERRLIQTFDLALQSLARQQKARMIVLKDFMDADLIQLKQLQSLGWFLGDSLPSAVLDTNYSNLDEYYAHLSTGMRKNIRRKLKKTSESAMEIQTVDSVQHCIEDIHRLYLAVRSNSDVQWEELTPDFFLNFSKYLPENTVFFLYWLKGDRCTSPKLIGFNLCLKFEDQLIDKMIGMDYSVSRKLNLYYVSFINNVQWCIDNHKSRYVLSQGGHTVKMQLGATSIPLRTVTMLMNPVLNWFANFFTRKEQEC